MVHCLALDFGASSIRVVDIALVDERLHLQELARLANGPVSQGGHLIWDYPKIFSWLEQTLCTAGASGVPYASVGADSWGVDYVLLDGAGQMIGAPVSYRDPRSAGQIDMIAAHIGPADLYAATGIPNMSFNTLYQLAALQDEVPQDIAAACRLLFTADYVHYWLSGVAANERTLASTSQMLGLDGGWLSPILCHLGLSDTVLPLLVAPGTALGPVRSPFGLNAQVIAPASHDTQSAILAVPAVGDDWAYLSSGTWSILGVESSVPFTGPAALAAGIGNEAGFGGTFCVQSTVTGLWLVQEISRQLGGADIASLALAAAEATPMRTLINPAAARFLAPPDMIAEIRMAARETGEAVPQTPDELVRCAYDSLALFYRSKITELSALTGRAIRQLHVVGGGAHADLLNRLCAAATGLTVWAGPGEATALGNGLAQLISMGVVADAAAARRLVRDSFAPTRCDPIPLPGLDAAVARFDKICTNHQELV